MAYVPGYDHDIFVSYAHGDNRAWVLGLVALLESALQQRLGTRVNVFIDAEDLRASRNYKDELPATLNSSASLLFLPSPTFIRSTYCVNVECAGFERTIASRRARYPSAGMDKELFAFRCPILAVENDEHRTLIEGLSDINFFNDGGTLLVGHPDFEVAFRKLLGELIRLLQSMRNQSTPVFLYPARPAEDLAEAHHVLSNELSAQRYRILPDRETNLNGQLRQAALSVFLLGKDYDEVTKNLLAAAGQSGKPVVIWCSPESLAGANPTQLAFLDLVAKDDLPTVTNLGATSSICKLKEEVLALLKPEPAPMSDTEARPRVYLIYNNVNEHERLSAGYISYHYQDEFHFEFADNRALHVRRLTQSHGVLLVWGQSPEEWCSHEFGEMMQAKSAGTKGLCLFDPPEDKVAALRTIRAQFGDLPIAELFGPFDPARLEPFFGPIRRRVAGPS